MMSNLNTQWIQIYRSIEPLDELLVRDKSRKHVEALKVEIQNNPTADVQPIVCILSLVEVQP